MKRLRPTEAQERLLRFSYGQSEDPASAWDSIRQRVNFRDPGRSTFALLPLLSRRLERLAFDDPDVALLRGICRRSWYRNQLLIKDLTRALAVFADAELDVVVVGGTAVATGYAEELALRPLDQLELLVDQSALDRAGALLKHSGWTPLARSLPTGRLLLRAEAGSRLVISTLLLEDFPGADSDRELLALARPRLVADGVQARFLPPEGELLRACLDPFRLEQWRRLEWVLDAVAVVTAAPRLDLELLPRQALARRGAATTADALGYLRSVLELEQLQPALAALTARPPDVRERLAALVERRPGGFLGQAPARLAAHLRAYPGDSLARTLAAAPAALSDAWGLAGPRQLPRAAVAKGVRRLTRARAA